MISLWNRIELSLIGLLGAGALLLALFVMTTRYLLPEWSIDWGEEVIVYLLVWAIWLSGSQLIGGQGHVQTDFVSRAMSPAIQYWLNLLHYMVGLTFSVIMFWASSQVVWFAVTIGETTESSMHFPLSIYYLSIPCGLLLMAIRYCHKLMYLFAEKRGQI